MKGILKINIILLKNVKYKIENAILGINVISAYSHGGYPKKITLYLNCLI